jgi:hypothetical protein
MTTLHLGQRDAGGHMRPACGADPQAPVASPEDFKHQARQGHPVCDPCTAIATTRDAESALKSKT